MTWAKEQRGKGGGGAGRRIRARGEGSKYSGWRRANRERKILNPNI